MTTKSDFSTEEWQLILEAPPSAVVLGRPPRTRQVDRSLGAARQVVLVGRDIADDLPEGDRR